MPIVMDQLIWIGGIMVCSLSQNTVYDEVIACLLGT